MVSSSYRTALAQWFLYGSPAPPNERAPADANSEVLMAEDDSEDESDSDINDHNTSATSESGSGFESDLEFEDMLSLEDSVALNDLWLLEQRFEDYSWSPLNLSSLVFRNMEPGATGLESQYQDAETVLDMFPPALAATKQLVYRICGYQSIIGTLEGMELLAGPLQIRHSSLSSTIFLELDRLLIAIQSEHKYRIEQGDRHKDIRHVHLVSSALGRVMLPMVKAAVILIAICHCMMGVAREHCNFLLQGMRIMLQLVADIQDTRARMILSNHINLIPIMLPTALHYLELHDGIDMYIVCLSCDTLYKEVVPSDVPDICSAVNLDGDQCGAEMFKNSHQGNHSWRQAKRRFSHQPLESWLCRFLSRPGIEDMLESTSPNIQSPCTDIWEAQYLSEFPGKGEPSFFDCPADQLHLAFLLYHDFFNPYGNQMAGKKYSIGLVMMVCLNLPPDVRYNLKNIYVTAMLPGPKEPSLDHINSFMRPVVTKFCEHYETGVYVTWTHKYPAGWKVRSAVPVTSMDIVASRAFAGISGHMHMNFCSFCEATLRDIDNFNYDAFEDRSIESYREHVQQWLSATSLAERTSIWQDHGVRHTEWFNPFTGTTIAPLHWVKNILEKHIRENMGASLTVPASVPTLAPNRKPVTSLELAWGELAMKHLSATKFEKGGLTEPILRYLCQQCGIFAAGISKQELATKMNIWCYNQGLLCTDGSPITPDHMHAVSLAKVEYFLNKAVTSKTKTFEKTLVSIHQQLCTKFGLPWFENEHKDLLVQRLYDYYKTRQVEEIPQESSKESNVAILGCEIVEEIQEDMKRAIIPDWLKTPPGNFSSVNHGKLASEEYKSLALISLPITLIRLWLNAKDSLKARLDHFLHLSVAIRILSLQSLTAYDISMFDYHYSQYLSGLKELYPFNSITPVQHLGIHIPYFLHKLGPTTHYTENTCEMFIGILQSIPTNSRLGQLEQTLHRELIMAANLKAMVDHGWFSETLAPLGTLINEFLQNRYPGSERPSSMTWVATHSARPIAQDNETYGALCSWATVNRICPFTRNLLVCTKLRWGNVVYQPTSHSSSNSIILFCPRGMENPLVGHIETILQEPPNAVGFLHSPRTIIVVRIFKPLSDEDKKYDPYNNHPIVGSSRMNIMALFYAEVEGNTAYIIQPDDIVSHAAACTFHDPENMISAPCLVLICLDLKHTFAT